MPQRQLMLVALAALVILTGACSGAAPTATPAPTPAATATALPAPAATPVPTPMPTATPRPTPTPLIPLPDTEMREGNLRVAVRAEPASLDLVQERDPYAWPVLLPQMSWLVANEQGRRGPMPDLAERWEAGGDGRRYTFHLAGGVSWHDGAPFTAEDVVFSINRALKAIAAPYGRTLSAIQSVRAPDNATVEFVLSRPDPAFIAGLGVPGNVVFARRAAAENIAGYEAVGTGPFRFSRRLEGIKTVLERNPTYFRKDARGQPLPYLSGVELLVVQDTNTEWTLMRLGQLDLSSPASPRDWGNGREDVERRLLPFGLDAFATVEYQLTFPNRGPWANLKLRQTVRDIVGRRAFHEAVNLDYGPLLSFLMPAQGRWAFPPHELVALPGYADPPLSTGAARQSLAGAGLALPPSALMRTLQGHEAAGQAAVIQAQRFFAEGAALVVDGPAAFLAAKVGLQFDLVVEPVAFHLDDPTFVLDRRFRSFGPDNAGRWSDPQVDTLLDRIASDMDPSARQANTIALQRRLLDLSWTAPLGTETMLRAHSRRVWGLWTPLHLEDGPAYRMEQVWLRR